MSPFPPLPLKKMMVLSTSKQRDPRPPLMISEPVRNSFVHVSTGVQAVAQDVAAHPLPHTLTVSSQVSDASTVVGSGHVHVARSPTLSSATFSYVSRQTTESTVSVWKSKLKGLFVKRREVRTAFDLDDLVDSQRSSPVAAADRKPSFFRRCLRTSSRKSATHPVYDTAQPAHPPPSLSKWKSGTRPPPVPDPEPLHRDTVSIATTLAESKYSTDQEAIKLMQKIEQLFKEI